MIIKRHLGKLLFLYAQLVIFASAVGIAHTQAAPRPGADIAIWDEPELITIQGQTYKRRQGIETVLLLGIDTRGIENTVGQYGRNGGQADFLMLMVIDSKEETLSLVQIDRDTMVPVQVLGEFGNPAGEKTLQIALSHGYGDGKMQSCTFTSDAVSKLFLNQPIDYYVALNLDGIALLNDAMGGVTVTLEEDFSLYDPTLTKGKTLTLHGDQAEYYVRGRMDIGDGTNAARMLRQRQYIAQLADMLEARLRDSPGFIGGLFDTLKPVMHTNMKRGRIINVAWNARDYARTGIKSIKGEHEIAKTGLMTFRADTQHLTDIALSLFYEQP